MAFIIKVDANPGFCGVDAGGVQFSHGQAVTDDARMAAWFAEHEGYSVAEEAAEAATGAAQPEKKTRAQLVEEAKALGVEVPSKATVAEVEALIAAAAE